MSRAQVALNLNWIPTLLCAVVVAGAQNRVLSHPARPGPARNGLPVHFVENRGVHPGEVKFSVQGSDRSLFFTNRGITIHLRGEERGWVVKVVFVGADPDVQPRGDQRQEAIVSYFKGPRCDWRTGLRTFGRVVYEDLWPGIDLIYEARVGRLKYALVVRPGADPRRIQLAYRGATRVAVTPSGGLRVETPVARLDDSAPVAFQRGDDGSDAVDCKFVVESGGRPGERLVRFRVAPYDSRRCLVIDPAVFVYCGYLGGAGRANDVAVDGTGSAYVTGQTTAAGGFPVKVGPDLSFNGGQSDAFVAKVNPAGTALVYCGYIGGSADDTASAIAVDSAGNAYVAGATHSDQTTFPVKKGPDLTKNGPLGGDVFVAKIDPTGRSLVYCGYLGGAGMDWAFDVAVDARGSAYVCGLTTSTEATFPVRVGPDLTFNGPVQSTMPPGMGDAFVAKVNASGQALDYCGYVGGPGDEWAQGIAVDAAGNAYLTGWTRSDQASLPVRIGPTTTSITGMAAFVCKVNARGTGFVYFGLLANGSSGYGIAVDAAGHAYIVGDTAGWLNNLAVRVGPDLTPNGLGDAFVAKVNPQGNGFLYCGYIGGASMDQAHRVEVDRSGSAYVMGWTASSEASFPIKEGPDLTFGGPVFAGGGDAFLAKVSPTGASLVYCGYIGGTAGERGSGLAVDGSGNAYVAGWTMSGPTSFPLRVGPVLAFHGGDPFVAKIAYLAAIAGSGTTRPGGHVSLALRAVESPGLPYQVGASMSLGPIRFDGRELALGADALLFLSLSGLWPSVFAGFRGVLDGQGQARADIHIPNAAALIGLRIHSAFVTVDPKSPSGIRSVSSTFSFSVTQH